MTTKSKAADSKAEEKDATATPETIKTGSKVGTPGDGGESGAHDDGGTNREGTPDARAADPGRVDAEARDTGSAGSASVAAPANQNAATAGRGEELFAAEQTLRGGVTPAPAYPTALPREEQEENASAAALEVARNVTGTKDGVSTVLPAVGGTTNLAMTGPERYAQLDTTAVDSRGRLVGDYLDDREARIAQERRELIEQRGSQLGDERELREAAADRVRALASSPATPAADAGKPYGEQALVNPDKHTAADSSDVNDPRRRASERAEAGQAGGARA